MQQQHKKGHKIKIKIKAIKKEPRNIANGVMLFVRMVMPAEKLPPTIVESKLFLKFKIIYPSMPKLALTEARILWASVKSEVETRLERFTLAGQYLFTLAVLVDVVV